MTSPRVFFALSLVALMTSAHQMQAQACAGLPQRSSIAFEHGSRTVGSIGYDLSAHYRFVFAGIALRRTNMTQGLHPESARYLLGVTIGGFKKKK